MSSSCRISTESGKSHGLPSFVNKKFTADTLKAQQHNGGLADVSSDFLPRGLPSSTVPLLGTPFPLPFILQLLAHSNRRPTHSISLQAWLVSTPTFDAYLLGFLTEAKNTCEKFEIFGICLCKVAVPRNSPQKETLQNGQNAQY